MFQFLTKILESSSTAGRNTAKQSPKSKRTTIGKQFKPQLEALEDRRLMSSFSVASTVRPTLQSANASSANGMSVVVWTVQNSASDTNIMAQRFNADQTKLGNAIAVATTAKKEHDPAVAMDAQGNFVVVWTRDWSSTDQDIKARLVSSEGTRGAVLNVANRIKREFDPSVAMDSAGNFVVSYTLQNSATNLDVLGRRFNSDGNSRGKDFGVSTRATANEFASSVARTDDGRFDIAYQIGENIELKRFGPDGNNSGFFSIATSNRSEKNPSVAMDAAGNSIVAWQVLRNGNWNIKARRVSSDGTRGAVLTVTAENELETNPAVALSRDGSQFVVAYQATQVGGTLVPAHVKIVGFSLQNGNDTQAQRRDFGNAVGPSVSFGVVGSLNGFGDMNQYLVTYTVGTPSKVTGDFSQVSRFIEE